MTIKKQIKKIKFSITAYSKDKQLIELVKKTDKKILAIWASDCTLRVLPYFENEFQNDNRPRTAINILKNWINTNNFNMQIIRKASLDSHAAARETNKNNAARSAARSAGQAVATAHVKTHSIYSASYALQSIHYATEVEYYDLAITKEREWQYKHLIKLRKKLNPKKIL
ncbi:MAG: hypothetical protein PHX27_03960 [Candidatus ainarchaeum sp.]|nr:hypothetical protein [Candidatus ainarchaeum sp.]